MKDLFKTAAIFDDSKNNGRVQTDTCVHVIREEFFSVKIAEANH